MAFRRNTSDLQKLVYISFCTFACPVTIIYTRVKFVCTYLASPVGKSITFGITHRTRIDKCLFLGCRQSWHILHHS